MKSSIRIDKLTVEGETQHILRVLRELATLLPHVHVTAAIAQETDEDDGEEADEV